MFFLFPSFSWLSRMTGGIITNDLTTVTAINLRKGIYELRLSAGKT